MTALLVLSAALAADPAAAPAVALVLEITGEASARRADKAVPLDDGDLLRTADKLVVPAGSKVKVYFRPAGPVAELAGPAEAVVQPGRLDTTAAVAVKDTKLAGRAGEALAASDTRSNLVGGVTLRGVQKHPLLHPVPGMAVASTRPSFSWPAVEGAKKYRVEVLTPGTSPMVFNPVGYAETVENKGDYPAGRKPLEAGKPYAWKVTAELADGTKVPVVGTDKNLLPFTVLPADAELAKLEALAKSDDPAELMLAAEAYRALRLFDEPVRLYEKLAAKKPSAVRVRQILAEYYEQAGDDAKLKTVKAELDKLGGKK